MGSRRDREEAFFDFEEDEYEYTERTGSRQGSGGSRTGQGSRSRRNALEEGGSAGSGSRSGHTDSRSRGEARRSRRGTDRKEYRIADADEYEYEYDYSSRREQWLRDEGESRRIRHRKKREAQLRRKKRIAAATILILILAAVLIRAVLPKIRNSSAGSDAVDVLAAEDAAGGTEDGPEEEGSGDSEDGDLILLSGEGIAAEEEEEEEEELITALYSYYETANTIDLGESLTDISIYDAQRHIASASAEDAGEESETYGDDGNSETEDTSSEDTYAAATADDYIDSQYVIVVNADTGEIIAERNAFEQIIPASMTKVMTLLVAVEALEASGDLETVLADTFTMTQEICDESYLSGSSFVGYGVGDEATVEDMLYGTILPSGADAAMGLAEYTAGSQEAFVALMNEKCGELGISATTQFTNVIGLYDNGENYSTPYDMCVIMNAAMENDLCREILSTRTWTTQAIKDNPDGTTISNWFLRRAEDHIDDWEILCGKTGYVNESGNCAVSCFQSSTTGTNYIACTALTYSSWRCIYDHAAIYNTYAD